MHTLTLRLPDHFADEAATMARTQGKSLTQFIIAALMAHVKTVRADPEFQAHVRARIDSNRNYLAAIKSSHSGYCYPDCGCPESDAFDWDGFADDINGFDPDGAR